MTAALTHDMDETTHGHVETVCGGVTGDIVAGGKSDADRELQSRIRALFYKEVLKDLPQASIKRIEAIVSHEDQSILGEIYRAAHELQALETTHIAERTLRSGNFDADDQRGIEEIMTSVRADITRKLKPHFGKFACLETLADNIERTLPPQEIAA
jgi:hypothetical protein